MADGIDPTQGMAEFSPCGPTRVTLLRNGAVTVQDVTPEDFGTRRVAFETVASRKTAAANARRILEVLEGDGDSPEADFFCMNAAAALHIADVAPSYSEGFTKAKAALAAGKAREKLEQLRELRG
jgi:anthranilate phosphoribosyltransferase